MSSKFVIDIEFTSVYIIYQFRQRKCLFVFTFISDILSGCFPIGFIYIQTEVKRFVNLTQCKHVLEKIHTFYNKI